MNCLKRAVATVAVLVLIFSLAACSTAAVQTTALSTAVAATASPVATKTIPADTSAMPSPSEVVATPSPEPEETVEPDGDETDDYAPEYNIPDMKIIGLTNEQYHNIDLLLCSALPMNSEQGPPFYFKDASKLTPLELFKFLGEILEDSFTQEKITYIENDDTNCLIDKSEIEKVLKSAFNIDYKSDYTGDDDESSLIYKDGIYTDRGVQGSQLVPYVYKITRIAPDKLQLQMDVIGCDGGSSASFESKAIAILQENTNSMFGYNLLSLTEIKENVPRFTKATTSSFLPPKGKINFKAANVLDKKDKTAWVTTKGTGEWIKISANKPQSVTGIEMQLGDLTNDDTVAASGQPSRVLLEFSDGTSAEYDLDEAFVTDSSLCITFGRAISTTYVKITILGIDPDLSQTNIYISGVSPF